MKIAIGALRFFQLVFSAVVLGLSITIAKGQVVGPVPATTGFDSFCGAFGIIGAVVGLGALFVEPLNGIVTWILDALTGLCLLAGGVAMTIALKGADCGDWTTLWNKKVLNCGTVVRDGQATYECGFNEGDKKAHEILQNRCREARADEVFMFLAFAVSGAALITSFLWKRRDGAGSNNYMI